MIFKGKVIGDAEVLDMIKRAPSVYMRYMRAYLNYAGKTFIGNKKKNGYLRNLLANKGATRSGHWSTKFINSVARYELSNSGLAMRAGIIYNNKRKIHEIMENLESGFTRNSTGYMIVPNHRDLPAGTKKPMALFNNMLNSNALKIIFKHGNIYYISKETGRIMFTGTKQIRVKSQFNFESAWSAVKGKIDKKADSVLDRATAAVEKKEAKAAEIG